MLRWIIEQIIGVKLNWNNLNLEWNRIFSCVIVIVFSYFILAPLFPIIDSLIQSSGQPWYADVLAKYSFVAISIRIIFLSLFTCLNNPLGRFKVVFSLQLTSVIGNGIIHYILNWFINPSPNINQITKSALDLFPFLLNIVVFFSVRQIYNMRRFDEDQFFQNYQ